MHSTTNIFRQERQIKANLTMTISSAYYYTVMSIAANTLYHQHIITLLCL